MDGILLQTAEGLGDAPLVRTGCETWERLQGEKEEVAQELLSEGPLCQTAVSGVQEAEPSEENWRDIEWRHRGQLDARLRDCGGEIPSQRLAADAAALFCINCQRSAESESPFHAASF